MDYMALNNIECSPGEFIKDYKKWGGFPLRFSFREETSIKRFLDNLYSNIINRDIIKKSSKMDKNLLRIFPFILCPMQEKNFLPKTLQITIQQNVRNQ